MYLNLESSSQCLNETDASQCKSRLLIDIAFKGANVTTVHILIRIMSFLGLLFFLVYFRNASKHLNEYYDERNCTLSDYSVIISDLPFEKGYRKKFSDFFDKGYFSKEIQID